MTLTEPASHTTNTDDDLDHYCCCHDETMHNICVVCDDLAPTWYCPNGWTCT